MLIREIPDGFQFHEVDGMISLFSPQGAREQSIHLLQNQPGLKRWQLEKFINHPTHDATRKGLRVAKEYAQELMNALSIAHPKRGFVIEQAGCGEYVTFYQRGENAPEESVPSEEPLPEQIWCENCDAQRGFLLCSKPDEEFPLADWAECAACGAEMLIRTWHERTCIGSSAVNAER